MFLDIGKHVGGSRSVEPSGLIQASQRGDSSGYSALMAPFTKIKCDHSNTVTLTKKNGMYKVLKSLYGKTFSPLTVFAIYIDWLRASGNRVSTGSDMSRYTALALTLHVALTLAISDSGTAKPDISPTSGANILSGEDQRKPKFLVSGVTTTTTLSTFTLCYTTSGTLTTPCKRKKRELPSENEIEDCSNRRDFKEETFQDSHDIDRCNHT